MEGIFSKTFTTPLEIALSFIHFLKFFGPPQPPFPRK